jgi:hypothetical protein
VGSFYVGEWRTNCVAHPGCYTSSLNRQYVQYVRECLHKYFSCLGLRVAMFARSILLAVGQMECTPTDPVHSDCHFELQ